MPVGLDYYLRFALGAPRVGQQGAPPPGYRVSQARGNATVPVSQTQSASALMRMGVPPARGGPPLPLGASPNSSSPMGMVRQIGLSAFASLYLYQVTKLHTSPISVDMKCDDMLFD